MEKPEIVTALEKCSTYSTLCLCSECPRKGLYTNPNDCRTALLRVCKHIIECFPEEIEKIKQEITYKGVV